MYECVWVCVLFLICLTLPSSIFSAIVQCFHLEFLRVFRFGILFVCFYLLLLLLPLINCGVCWSSQYQIFWSHAQWFAHDSSSSSHLTQIWSQIPTLADLLEFKSTNSSKEKMLKMHNPREFSDFPCHFELMKQMTWPVNYFTISNDLCATYLLQSF